MAFTQLSFPGFSGERSTGTALFIPGNWHRGASNTGRGGFPAPQQAVELQQHQSTTELVHRVHTVAPGGPGHSAGQLQVLAAPNQVPSTSSPA